MDLSEDRFFKKNKKTNSFMLKQKAQFNSPSFHFSSWSVHTPEKESVSFKDFLPFLSFSAVLSLRRNTPKEEYTIKEF